jgi:hypothetical protein
VTTPSGAFVVSFMTNEDTGTAVNAAGTGEDFKIMTSVTSQSPSWGNKFTVSPVTTAWPGLMVLGDSVLACGTNNGATCRFVTFT